MHDGRRFVAVWNGEIDDAFPAMLCSALALVESYLAYHAERGYTPAHFALTWCAAQPGVTSPRTMEQMDDYLAAMEFIVTDEGRQHVDTIFESGTYVSNYYRADFGPNARWQ